MKKLFTLAFFALLAGALWAASPNVAPANPFQDDLSRLDSEFAGMTELELLVLECNATYSQLAMENNSLLNNVTSDHQDISSALLGAGSNDGMDSTLKTVLIVLGVLVVIACGCFLISVILAAGTPQ